MRNEHKLEMYRDFCAGCGLCHSINQVELQKSDGFVRPKLSQESIALCDAVCPCAGNHLKYLSPVKPWGSYQSAQCTWSADEEIRFMGSSGGSLTGISLYLIENGVVDGIIHTGVAHSSVIETQVFISTSRQEIIEHCGSRYTVSSPLENILQIVDFNKRYAFIGKPCDVTALRQYMKINAELQKAIPIILSFFCAGLPSRSANEKLLHELGTNEVDCQKLNYRGEGWPGFATAESLCSEKKRMTYDESWGRILGRNINRYCKFCMDGIGESADIACGDAWYMTEDKKPDFTEHSGRNITFVRSEIGQKILDDAINQGYIIKQEYDLNELKYVQYHQFTRRAQMFSKILGLKLCMRRTPGYSLKMLWQYAKGYSFMYQLRITLGTVKRVLNNTL